MSKPYFTFNRVKRKCTNFKRFVKYSGDMTVRCLVILFLVSVIRGCEIDDRTFRCAGLNLTEIPSPYSALDYNETFNEFWNLDLSFNSLENPINLSTWFNHEIKVLDLSYNRLSRVDSDTFFSMKHLKELNISNNMLLSVNFIWSQLPLIQSLNLANNVHLHGSLNIFSDVWNSSVTHLNLSKTNVSPASGDIFSKMINLKSLDLSGNQLGYIPSLPANLEYLDFSNNSIRHVDPDCFSEDIRLKTLLLEYNSHLQDVRYESFSYLLELRRLSFRGCSSLSHLPTSLFFYNKKLEYLSLADCNFRNISVTFLSSFLGIKKIDLEQNPWHCSAHIKWFIQLHDQNIISDDVRCSTPENISLVEYLGPKVKHKIVRILLTIISVILFCMLITAAAFSFNMEKKRRETQNSYTPLESSSKPFRGSMIYVTSSV